jgi:hypothetical protein
MITGRSPRQLQDREKKMPHEAFAECIPDSIRKDSRWRTFESIFNIGFQIRTDDRFQSTDDLRRYLEMLTGSNGDRGKKRLELAQRRFDQVRRSDEVRLPELARKHIHNVSNKLYEILRSTARMAGFEFDNNPPSMFDEGGRLGSNMLLGIYKADIKGIGTTGHHSIEFRDNQFIAAYQTDWTGQVKYFQGSVFAPALLEEEVTNIAPTIVALLIEEYTERLNQQRKK